MWCQLISWQYNYSHPAVNGGPLYTARKREAHVNLAALLITLSSEVFFISITSVYNWPLTFLGMAAVILMYSKYLKGTT